MEPPFAYELDEPDFAKCRRALETIPRDQWPSDDMWCRVYISVRMKAMEQAEQETMDLTYEDRQAIREDRELGRNLICEQCVGSGLLPPGEVGQCEACHGTAFRI